MLIFNAIVVVFLIFLNGFFAMSELAVVSARRGRLQQMAQEGSHGAARALKLADDPTSFLSTVQVGITLVGIFAGAFGASAFAGPLADMLAPIPGIGAYSQGIAFTTYGDLARKPEVRELVGGWVDEVNGELAQVEAIKRFALLDKELDHEDGELTATQKVKRKALEERFADTIEELYR